MLSVEETEGLADAAKRHDCRVHIDGARLVNAAAALDVPLASLAAPANSIAFSLNKGLSAPMGTVLAGSEAVVDRARTMLHRLGGSSVHKAGIAAAAALVALDTMLDRIADDHRRARDLAERLAAIPGLHLDPEDVETNIVLVDVTGTGLAVLRPPRADRGGGGARDGARLRAPALRHAPPDLRRRRGGGRVDRRRRRRAPLRAARRAA